MSLGMLMRTSTAAHIYIDKETLHVQIRSSLLAYPNSRVVCRMEPAAPNPRMGGAEVDISHKPKSGATHLVFHERDLNNRKTSSLENQSTFDKEVLRKLIYAVSFSHLCYASITIPGGDRFACRPNAWWPLGTGND